MNKKEVKIYTYTPEVEIISTSRAKKRAAEKLKIPFSIGDELKASRLLRNKEYYIHVDLSNISGFRKYEYYKLMKKYYIDEVRNILHPHHKLKSFIAFSSFAIALGALTYYALGKENQINPEPQKIQKAMPNQSAKEAQNTRE